MLFLLLRLCCGLAYALLGYLALCFSLQRRVRFFLAAHLLFYEQSTLSCKAWVKLERRDVNRPSIALTLERMRDENAY
jgi:hypothetical protein